ncbi:TetR family transcriptional regulator C-terminal domain-containing protein [Frigidibacter sp. ROC022]|uniref:TetR family transcriptional regulator C-terminal domain-containing protein n=1 Tax=Frigidibacter sp. ROC022 TaxID=2971796 RepID=UPI00215B56F9|nr:TetR family transcriptional regulator C-terminal domain-containing protein [Frigidibacter sp. ROC022]MCR8724556.1 TetR family transcriptional regulator C-terminal domain-containing protein [Frigidibacter sp. ROC022]
MSSDKADIRNDGKSTARGKVLERRRRILAAIRDAAIDEFASKGLVGASTQAIAQRAGLTKPQLHYYISSKEELYEDILVYILDEWKEIFISSSAGDTPEQIIRAYIHKKLEYGKRNPKASRLFTAEITNGAPFLSRHLAQYQASTQEAVALIRSWVDQELIRPVDPLLFQMHIWAVTQHYADFEVQIKSFMQIGENEEFDMDHVEEEVVTLFLRACGLK